MAIITGKIEAYDESNVIIKGHNPIFIAPENRAAAKKNFPPGTAVKLTHVKGTATAMENLDESILPPEGGTFKRASEITPASTQPAATSTSATAQKTEPAPSATSTKPSGDSTEQKPSEKQTKPSEKASKKPSKEATTQPEKASSGGKAKDDEPVSAGHAAAQAGAKSPTKPDPKPQGDKLAAKETEPKHGELNPQGSEVAPNASSDSTAGLSTVADDIESVSLGCSLRFGAYNNIKVDVTGHSAAAATFTFRSLVEEQKRYIKRTIEDIRKEMEKMERFG